MRMVGVVAHLRFCANALLRPGRMFTSDHVVMVSVHTFSTCD